MSVSEPLDDASKTSRWYQNQGRHPASGSSVEGTYLLTMRPAYRRHDSYLGFRTEPEYRVGDDKGKGTSEPHEAESTDARIRGALLRKSEVAG